MIKPRQVLYDINHFGFFNYVILSIFRNKKKYNKKFLQYHRLFQDKFYEITGIENVLPLSRARIGIYLYLKEIITSDKNEVLLSPFTIFDVVNMVICAGGKPIFIDINKKNDLNLNPINIEKNISDKTCCILLTHYHLNNQYIKDIKNICKNKNIKLLEDCAISLGSKVSSKHVGYFSDASIYSFSIFKFISVYQGGSLYIKDKKIRDLIYQKLNLYSTFKWTEMLVYVLKAVKFSLITNKYIFPIVFGIIRFGYFRDIQVIRNSVKNDPRPFLRYDFPKNFYRKVNLFQLQEFTRQLSSLQKYQIIRKYNFLEYNKILGLYRNLSKNSCNSFLNYPIVFSSYYNKKLFLKYIMKRNFDIGEYYYRSCNKENIFSAFKKTCPNSEHYSKCVVLLPTHKKINKNYIIKLCKYIKDFINENPNCLTEIS